MRRGGRVVCGRCLLGRVSGCLMEGRGGERVRGREGKGREGKANVHGMLRFPMNWIMGVRSAWAAAEA